MTTKAQKDVHHWRLQIETHNIPEQHVYGGYKQNTEHHTITMFKFQ